MSVAPEFRCAHPDSRRAPLAPRVSAGVLPTVLLATLAALLPVLPGCVSPVEIAEEAATGGRSERKEALAELAFMAREGQLDRIDAAERERIDALLLERFAAEPNPVWRARILSIADDADFPCALDLLRTAFEDPALAVRIEAVERASSLPPEERRDALAARLLGDADPLVRIAAARAYRTLGDASWARELVDVVVDTRTSVDVRFHAYLSAVELTGADLMFLEEDWRAWLEEHGS